MKGQQCRNVLLSLPLFNERNLYVNKIYSFYR